MATVEHKSESSGKIYIVDIHAKSCSCPDFRYRRARFGGICKHITAELENVHEDKKEAFSFILGDSDAVAFVEEFDEERLDKLKAIGAIVEDKGRLFIVK